MIAAKRVIFEGFERALAGGPIDGAGVLVDEQYAADVARSARERGMPFAMPVEKSGQDEFDFEFGERFGDHIREFSPTFAKVLVRYNPGGDREMNARQAERLARLSRWLRDDDRKFLFELLVPAEPAQLTEVGGDADRYDREVRPGLMIEAIGELHAAGIEPDIWKIEGLDAREDCKRVAEATRIGGRDQVTCVVLGRGGERVPLAPDRRRRSGLHRLRRRPHDLVGRAQAVARRRRRGRGRRADRRDLSPAGRRLPRLAGGRELAAGALEVAALEHLGAQPPGG